MNTNDKRAALAPTPATVETSAVAVLAAVPEEEVWLASQKSARTRRAYRQDVAHFTGIRRKKLEDYSIVTGRLGLGPWNWRLEESSRSPSWGPTRSH